MRLILFGSFTTLAAAIAVGVTAALPGAAQLSPPSTGANTKFCQDIAAQTETAHAVWDDGLRPNRDGRHLRAHLSGLYQGYSALAEQHAKPTDSDRWTVINTEDREVTASA